MRIYAEKQGFSRMSVKEVAAIMVFEKLKGIISEQLNVDESIVTLDASFKDDLGADSLDIVELVMAVEEEFDIEFPDEDAENISTVADAVEYIGNLIG